MKFFYIIIYYYYKILFKRMKNTVTLNNGIKMPILGFGVYLVSGRECFESVKNAIEVGYRHIDTAQYYGNEKEVGEAIRASKVPREEIFVTTKTWIFFYKSRNRKISKKIWLSLF